jgi:hypothetical protein
VRLSALCAGRPLPPRRFLVLISVRGWVVLRLEGLGQLKKNPMTSLGIEPANFRLVAIVPQPATLLRAPSMVHTTYTFFKYEKYWQIFENLTKDRVNTNEQNNRWFANWKICLLLFASMGRGKKHWARKLYSSRQKLWLCGYKEQGVKSTPCWQRVNYLESVTPASNELPITHKPAGRGQEAGGGLNTRLPLPEYKLHFLL